MVDFGNPEKVPFRDEATGILSQLVQPTEDLHDIPINERRWQWARPQVEGIGPCARGGHTATLVGPIESQKMSARIIVFGGHYGGDAAGFSYLNDTYVLDVDENTWQKPRCRGTPPEPRYGHSAALVGTRIVYFGGKGKTAHFRDLHALDATSLTWFQGPSSGGAPAARHGHTSTLWGTKLFVFGGACGPKYFGDLHCLDLSSMAWSVPSTDGPKPGPRSGHAALLIGETLVIHGGFCMDTTDLASKVNSGQLLQDCYLADMRVLDLGRMIWSRLRTHGTPPLARFGHTLALTEDDIVLFGGWSGVQKEASQGVLFSLRHKVKEDGTTGAPKDDEQTCDYCVALRTSDMRYTPCKFGGVPASRRYGHSATTIGPHLIIFGGWDGGKPLSDLIVLRDRSPGGSQSQSQPMGDETLGQDLGFDGDQFDEGVEDDFQLET